MKRTDITTMYKAFLNVSSKEKLNILYDVIVNDSPKISKYPVEVSVDISPNSIFIESCKLDPLNEVINSLIAGGLILTNGELCYDYETKKFYYEADYIGEENQICYN